ncbi:hypothetical protein, partial [Streptomyces sp. HPF1205]|uniref:hypothetical protein n=1 Tax=Streptomyces sp. HPF1205 TaxID=2873262 RepID=UPI001CEDDF02
ASLKVMSPWIEAAAELLDEGPGLESEDEEPPPAPLLLQALAVATTAITIAAAPQRAILFPPDLI